MTIPKQLLEAKICNKDTCEEIRTLKEELEKKNKKYWQSKCFEYQVENRRLNNDIKVLLKENEAKEKVIIKQNNVLNELKKDLQEAFNELQPNELINGRNLIENILNELKESDK